MPIQPRFTLGPTRPRAGRQFTDRQEAIGLFRAAATERWREATAGRPAGTHQVIVFYGVGGIGKTSLRKELARLLDETGTGTVHAALDFDVPSYRDQETALFALREALRAKFKFKFPTFDIAYAIYWQKTHPQTPLTRQTLPLLEHSDMLTEIVGAFGVLPFVGAIPKLAIAATKGSAALREWWTRRGSEELKGLPALEPQEVAERLPMFWAADVKAELAERRTDAVVFLDTYETLSEGVRAEGKLYQRDEWVRELVAQLPEVLWVICGRERLRWDQFDSDWAELIDHRLVGGLAEPDARQFLVSCDVRDRQVQHVIIDSSAGVPYYLDLSVDTFLEIRDRHGREPVPDDFGRTPREIFPRFIRHLSQPEVETLKLLSVPRFWDYGLFELMVNRYQTGYPLTGFADFCRFSFINARPIDGTWDMHGLMRDGLREHQPAEQVAHVNRTLFDRYCGQLAGVDVRCISGDCRTALDEAFFHGRRCLPALEFSRWFFAAAEPFTRAAQWRLLAPLCSELAQFVEEAEGPESPLLARALTTLSLVLRNLGKYSSAEPACRRGLEIRLRAAGPESPEVAESLSELVELCHYQGRYAEAEGHCRQALAIRERIGGPDDDELARALNDLASICSAQARFAEAEPLLRRALAIRERALGADDPELYVPLNNLAGVCDAIGQRDEAEPLLRRALDISRRQLGPEHPDVAQTLNSLATLYRNLGRCDEAEPLCRQALAIRLQAFGDDHPDTAQSQANLALILDLLGRCDEAEPLCRQALETRRRLLGDGHRDTATSLVSLGLINQHCGRHDAAERFFLQALAIREQALGPGHPAVAKVAANLAELYRLTGNSRAAAQLAARRGGKEQ